MVLGEDEEIDKAQAKEDPRGHHQTPHRSKHLHRAIGRIHTQHHAGGAGNEFADA